jgi:hypothetical protein
VAIIPAVLPAVPTLEAAGATCMSRSEASMASRICCASDNAAMMVPLLLVRFLKISVMVFFLLPQFTTQNLDCSDLTKSRYISRV